MTAVTKFDKSSGDPILIEFRSSFNNFSISFHVDFGK